MTETKFTPGPWIVKPVEGGEEYWITHDHFDAGPARIVMNKADAHLIAAAPEMCEALEGLVETITSGTHWEDGEPSIYAGPIDELFRKIDIASSALAKARGEDAS